MKKSLFIIASAALVLSSCAEDSLRNDIKGEEQAITFKTFAQKATRGADNSGATASGDLEKYHLTFSVWGSKYFVSPASGEGTKVFDNQTVKADASSDATWSYSPIRFWDKSAESYDFYAAAPAKWAWDFDFATKKVSLANFTVSHASLAPGTECTSNAVMASGDYDLMISHDEKRSRNYEKVNLIFDHILARINLAVRKADNLNDFIVKLDQVMIYEMFETGSFNEASGNAEVSGNAIRWTATAGTEREFGYQCAASLNASSDALASGDARVEIASGDAYYYVYQGLIIPQTVGYNGSVDLNASSDAKPYIKIGYSLYTASGDVIPGANYVYTYNLADIFNGKTASGDVTFNEGWQNTLKITIKPDAIEFDAKVYDWDGKYIGVEVPNNASGDAEPQHGIGD